MENQLIGLQTLRGYVWWRSGDEIKQRSLVYMEIGCIRMDYIATGSDIFNLSQLYYYHSSAIKAAAINGKLSKTRANWLKTRRKLDVFGSAWVLPKRTKSRPVMDGRSQIAKDGRI